MYGKFSAEKLEKSKRFRRNINESYQTLCYKCEGSCCIKGQSHFRKSYWNTWAPQATIWDQNKTATYRLPHQIAETQVLRISTHAAITRRHLCPNEFHWRSFSIYHFNFLLFFSDLGSHIIWTYKKSVLHCLRSGVWS